MIKLFTKVVNYLKSIIDPNHDNAEAKLFIALVSFFYVMVAGFSDLFFHLKPTDFVFYTIVSLIVACLGLGTYLAGKSMFTKGSVANTVIEDKAEKEVIDGAKEILKSDKP